jgi:hypothetical protein
MLDKYSEVEANVRRARKTAGRALKRRRTAVTRSIADARRDAEDTLTDLRDAAETAHARIEEWPHAAVLAAFALGFIASRWVWRRL